MISISYLGLVRADVSTLELGKGLRWCSVQELPKLAYDHNKMFTVALNRLKGKVSYTNITQFLLPNEFTLTELQTVYELILGRG